MFFRYEQIFDDRTKTDQDIRDPKRPFIEHIVDNLTHKTGKNRAFAACRDPDCNVFRAYHSRKDKSAFFRVVHDIYKNIFFPAKLGNMLIQLLVVRCADHRKSAVQIAAAEIPANNINTADLTDLLMYFGSDHGNCRFKKNQLFDLSERYRTSADHNYLLILDINKKRKISHFIPLFRILKAFQAQPQAVLS